MDLLDQLKTERIFTGERLAGEFLKDNGVIKVKEEFEKQYYLQTFTGKKFNPNDLQKSEVCIEDIAHGLSMQCRFGGHCSTFYSVAQHSVAVSNYFKAQPAKLRLAALMHDASEAYLCDMPYPIKRLLPEYSNKEKEVQSFLVHVLGGGMNEAQQALVKMADMAALVTEARDLMNNPAWTEHWKDLYNVDCETETIRPLSSLAAKHEFLDLYEELT